MSLCDIRLKLSLVCFALSHPTLSFSIQRMFFCPRIDLYGRVYQAVEAPYSEKLDVTSTECALYCMTSNCNSFNYDQSSNECSIFIGTLANLALANDSKINYEVCLTLEILYLNTSVNFDHSRWNPKGPFRHPLAWNILLKFFWMWLNVIMSTFISQGMPVGTRYLHAVFICIGIAWGVHLEYRPKKICVKNTEGTTEAPHTFVQ